MLILVFGTLFLLIQNQIYLTWLKALLFTAIILSIVYIILLGIRKRLTGSSEVAFIIAGFLIFVYLQQPTAQNYLPFQLTPLGLLDQAAGTVAVPMLWIEILLLALGVYIVWRIGLLDSIL